MSFRKGDYVKVSDGKAEPPKHHKKKHREWGYRNFKGFVWRDESASLGTVAVGITPNAAVVFSFPAHMVTLID